jgi:cobalt/nickel transport system permease protein
VHIPDGFLDAKTALVSGGIAATGVAVAVRSVSRTIPASRVPLIGVASAFVFAAQMLNFPVAGGTSGHLIGAVLAAVLLGPSAAVLVMTSVLTLQCFLFADGGVTALGANLFNMAIVAPVVGYVVYRLASGALGNTRRGVLVGTALGAWCSTVAAAISCAGQLALSRTAAWSITFPAMVGVHALIGVGEAVITTMVVAAVARARPELIAERGIESPRARYADLAGYGVLISIGLAIFVEPFASNRPDGLERVAARLGFAQHAAPSPAIASPLHDYAVPGLGSAVASTVVAGAIGIVVAFTLAYLLARFLAPRGAAGGGNR